MAIVDDCNEKLDWIKQLEYMSEILAATSKRFENTEEKFYEKLQSKIDTELKGKVLTPEGDERVGMRKEKEESAPLWATPTPTPVGVIQPKIEPIRGKRRKGRHKKQQKDNCKAL